MPRSTGSRLATNWRAARGRVIAIAAFLVVSLLVVRACEGPAPRLVDEMDAVREHQFHLGPDSLAVEYDADAAEAGPVVAEAPSGWDLRVVWIGTPCQTAPTVRVDGSDGRITNIHVDYGPSVGLGSCPSMGVIFGIDLRFSWVVAPGLAVTGENPRRG
jgi:hypothetical protein